MGKYLNPNISPDLRLPTIQSVAQSYGLNAKEINDQAYYSSAVSGSPNPVEEYFKRLEDLDTKGYSRDIERDRNQFIIEQQMQSEQQLQSIISDETISKEDKLNVLNQTVQSNLISTDLKDKYITNLANAKLVDTTNDDSILKVNTQVEDLKRQQDTTAFLKKLLNRGKDPYIKEATTEDFLNEVAQINPSALDTLMENIVDPVNKNFLALFKSLIISAPAYITELYDISAEANKPMSDLLALGFEKFLNINLREKNYWKDHPGYKNLTQIRQMVREKAKDNLSTEFIEAFQEAVEDGFGYTATDLEEAMASGALKTIDDALTYVSNKVNPDNPEAVKLPLELSLFFLPSAVKAGGKYSKKAYRYMRDPNAARLAELFDSPIIDQRPLYLDINNTRTAQEVGLDYSVDSPMTTTLVANNRLAKDISVEAILDDTGQLPRALGVTPNQLVYMHLVPEVVRKPRWGESFDATPGMRDAINLQKRAAEDLLFSPNKLTSNHNYTYLENVSNVLNSAHDGITITFSIPDWKFWAKETSMQSHVVFKKTDTDYYKTVQETTDAFSVLKNKIEEITTDNNTGTLLIEHVGPRGEVIKSYTLEELNRAPEFKLDSMDQLLAQRESTLAAQTRRKEILDNPELLEQEAVVQGVSVDTARSTIRSAFNRESKVLKELDQNISELQNYINRGEAPIDPNFRVVWDKTAEFIDIVNQEHGMGTMPWLGKTFEKIYNTRTFWNAAFVWGKINPNIESRMTMAALRSNKFMYEQLKVLKRELGVFNNQMKQDLAALYKAQQGVSDLFSLNQIHTLLNRVELTNSQAVKLQNVLAITRQVENFNYNLANLYEINRHTKAGYNKSITYLDNLDRPLSMMVREDFHFTPESHPPKVFDITTQEVIDLPIIPANMVLGNKKYIYIDGKPTKQIVRVASPLKDSSGATYDYIVLSEKTKLSDVPTNNIIPSKTGHMPNLPTGNFFLRAYPKVHVHNGIRKEAEAPIRDADGMIVEGSILTDMDPHKVSIAMFETETQAKLWIRNNIRQGSEHVTWDPDLYEFQIQKANELSPRDNIDAQIIRENALQTSRHRADAPLANAMYEDPFVAFVQSSETIGLRTYLQPVIQQLKQEWINAYYKKGKVNILENAPSKPRELMSLDELAAVDSAFPSLETQIKQVGNNSKAYKQALAEWDAIMVLEQGYPSTGFARGISAISDIIATALDKPSPLMQKLSKIARKAEKNPNMITAAPLRAISTAKIIFNMLWKNISLQHIGIYGPMLVANPKNFFRTVSNVYRTVGQKVVNARHFHKYKDYLTEVNEYLWEQEHIVDNTGIARLGKDKLTKQEIALVARHLEESGFGIISDHILARGIFSATPVRLVQSSAAKQLFEQGGSALVSGYSKIGFEFGEYINRVGMWYAARESWLQKNPGKNWKSKQALEQITKDAYALSGSMNPSHSYLYQRVSLLQYIGQFLSFGNKASENIINPSATPFSGGQRMALAAYNLAMWGPRAGFIYGIGGVILDWISSFGDEGKKLADLMDKASVFNLTTNAIGDLVSPTYDADGKKIKSKTEPSLSYSPFGTTPFGAYGAAWKVFTRMFSKENEPGYSFGPAMTTVEQLGETFTLMYNMYHREDLTWDEKSIESLKALAKLTSGGSALLRYVIVSEYQDKYNKQGQMQGTKLTNFEQFATLFGVADEASRKYYESVFANKKMEDKMKILSEAFYESLVVTEGPSIDLQTLVNAVKGFNSVVGGDNYSDGALEMFWDNLSAIHARSESRTGLDGLITTALKNYRLDQKRFTQEEIIMIRNLGEMIIRSHPNQRKAIEQLVQTLENSTKPLE